MNVNALKNKKSLKIITLLISALFIATASAYTYNMFMNATVGVTATELGFAANDPDYTTCGGAITDNNQKVTFSSMNGKAGVEAIYTPLEITNGAGAAHDVELMLDTWDGADQTNLYYIEITMYNGGTPQGDSIVLYPTGEGTSVTTSGSVNIGTSETWQVEWKVYWKGTATVGLDSVQVNLLLVVQS
jgi:hypothetical protein